MKRFLLLPLLAVLLVSCAGPQTKFKPVTTAPVHQSIQATDKKIESAQGHTKNLKDQLAKIEAKVPDMKDAFASARGEVDALTQDLLDARAQNRVTESKLKQADAQNVALVKEANKILAAWEKDEKELKLVHRWWGIGAILYGCGLLLKHFLILLGVLLMFIALLALLSQVFPPLNVAFQVAEVLIVRTFNKRW
jgi:hypothetical protein